MTSPSSILVTGARGFIGSHMARAFAAAGFEVVAIDRIEADLAQPGSLDTIMANRKIGAVIHCASILPQAKATREDFCRNNVDTLKNVLDAMKSNDVKKIFAISSINIFGNLKGITVTEKTPANPAGDYAWSKYEADCLLQKRSKADALTSVNLCLPSVFGRTQGGGMIENLLACALKNEEIEIYSRGLLWRNLIYIDDLVQTALQIASQWNGWMGYQFFLLGSENSLTQEAIVRRIAEKTASRSVIKLVDKTAPAEADWLVSLDHAKKTFGFKPRTLESMLDAFIEIRLNAL